MYLVPLQFLQGSGYFVVTPETFRLPTTGDPNTNTATFNNWLQYQPMYIPVFPQQQIPMVTHPPAPAPAPAPVTMAAQMRTVSCQVEASVQGKGVKPRSRSQSMRGPKGKEKEKSLETEDFKRVMSVRCRPEKAKEITKDINSKTNNVNTEKVKGEKTSLFSKLFGRNKKKSLPPPPVVVEPTGEKEKEYATFSAQFPPPEWQWYQQQQEKHRRTEQWVSQQMVKSRTWHYIGGATVPEPPQHGRCNTMDGGVTRVPHNPTQEGVSHNIYNTISRTGGSHGDYMVIDGLVDPITGAPIDPSSGNHQGVVATTSQEKMTNHRKSHHDDRRSRENLTKHGRDHPERKSQECLDRNTQENGGDRRRHGHRKHRSSRSRKERHQDQDENVDPYGVYGTQDPTSPVLASDNFYQPLTTCPGPYHSTPRYYDTIPSRQARDDQSQPYPAADHQPHVDQQSHRRSHRHRKKSSHHRNTYYGTHNEMDISYEYHGKLPNKNSTYAQSCDSGVNCVGLKPEQTTSKNIHKSRETMPLPRPHIKKQLDKLPEESEKPKADDGYVVMENHHLRRVPCNDGYDSSIMETPANTMIVCEAEINHHPIPQIVLDTEPQKARCYEPDVAQSSSSNNGSRTEISSTQDGSIDTIIEKDELTEDCRGNPAGEDNPEEKPECQQQDKTPIIIKREKSQQHHQTFVDQDLQPYKVDSVTLEVKELSLKDSGFSSPRYVELVGCNPPKQPATYQRFQEHMVKPVLKVNNSVSNNCAISDNVYENQSNCLRDPLQPPFENGRHLPHHADKCLCHQRLRPHDIPQTNMINNQRSIFRLKPDNLVQSQWVDGPGAADMPQQQVAYAKQFRLSGEFEVVGVV